jgi:nuclear transport factor 2 (NTF2) superfamily protein
MSKRNVNIRKRVIAKMWTCEVTDSYGITHVNYFETTEDASKWAYYIWENEDVKVDEAELMAKATAECIKMDIDRGVEPSLD